MKKIGFLILALAVFFVFDNITHADLNDGLVAYYPFNGNANDESGNGNNGTVTGATLTTDRFGNPDSAYHFTGGSDKIDCGNSLVFDYMDGVSYAGWIYPEDNSSRYILRKWVDTHEDKFLSLSSTGKFCLYLWSGVPGICSPQTIRTNRWTHVAGTYDGTTANVYVNGKRANSLDCPGGVSNSTGHMMLGYTFEDFEANNFIGKLDDIRVYNYALSAQEVKRLFGFPELPSIYSLILSQ